MLGIVLGFLVIVGIYGYAIGITASMMKERMRYWADIRDARLRESKKYGPEHNYSIRMYREAESAQVHVRLWAFALVTSPLWPIHAIVWALRTAWQGSTEFMDTTRWKG